MNFVAPSATVESMSENIEDVASTPDATDSMSPTKEVLSEERPAIEALKASGKPLVAAWVGAWWSSGEKDKSPAV